MLINSPAFCFYYRYRVDRLPLSDQFSRRSLITLLSYEFLCSQFQLYKLEAKTGWVISQAFWSCTVVSCAGRVAYLAEQKAGLVFGFFVLDRSDLVEFVYKIVNRL